MGLLDRIRPHPGWKEADPNRRRAAVRSLADPLLLAEIARADPEPRVRQEAIDSLLGLALQSADDAAALGALAGLSEPRHLVAVARAAAAEGASRAALTRLSDPRAIGSVARHGAHASVRLEALGRLQDPEEILTVALKGTHADAAVAALERLAAGADPPAALAALQAAAASARSHAATRRARAILRERQEAGRHAVPAPTDRARQTSLCEQVERLAARSEDCEQLASAIAAAQDAWTDLIPEVDDDLAERFAAAGRAARERLARNEAGRAERRLQEEERGRFIAQHVAPRIALCEAVETGEGEAIPRILAEARLEWDLLVPFHTPEIEALRRRFEDACAAAEGRQATRRSEDAAARARTEAATARQARARAAADNAARLESLCSGLEGLLAAGELTLKEADPRLREVRAALVDPGPLPSKRERHGFLKRLRALHQILAPQVHDLREADAWKRWANAGVQEVLCAAAAALRDIADPMVAAHRLNDIAARWKAASSVSRDRAAALWHRFKAARDEVIGRLRAHRTQQAAARAAGKAAKEALCERAEALAGSSDWTKTAEALRALQAEWKAAAPAPRREEPFLWERFRAAGDAFFKRRKEFLAARREASRRNLEARKALCERAESLAESTDWAATAAELKRLQAEWKTIGPAAHRQSEAVWQRFRAACDRFFERYKRREAIDRELAVALRESLCRELEALAAPSPGGPGIVEILRPIWARWQQAAPIPDAALAGLRERFDAALAPLLASGGEALRGTEFDVDANRRRLEDLCARAERLLPSGQGPDLDRLTPAARLAAAWREALASNTIGGKAGGEAKRRAAAEELQRIVSDWRKVAYAPEAIRRPLLERLETVSRRLGPVAERREPGRRAPAGRDRARAAAGRRDDPGRGPGRPPRPR
jgi:hypothetical protein